MKHIHIITLQLLLFSAFIQAQTSQEVFYNAVDEINCATAKTTLELFNRESAANKIKDCNYIKIKEAIVTVKENLIKGYKSNIIDIATGIDNFKQNIDNPSEYSLYQNALESLEDYALESVKKICTKYNSRKTPVCTEIALKSKQLEQQINTITETALATIATKTYGAGEAVQNKTTKNKIDKEIAISSDFEKFKDPNLTTNNPTNVNNTPTNNNDTSIIATLSTILLIITCAVVAWLFKENYELKNEVQDIKMVFKALMERKENDD